MHGEASRYVNVFLKNVCSITTLAVVEMLVVLQYIELMLINRAGFFLN